MTWVDDSEYTKGCLVSQQYVVYVKLNLYETNIHPMTFDHRCATIPKRIILLPYKLLCHSVNIFISLSHQKTEGILPEQCLVTTPLCEDDRENSCLCVI